MRGGGGLILSKKGRSTHIHKKVYAGYIIFIDTHLNLCLCLGKSSSNIVQISLLKKLYY